MSRMKVLTMLGFGVMLAVGAVGLGAAAASQQAAVQQYTGQVQSIKIDHCDQQSGACDGSQVLAQARGQEVVLAILSGTSFQRGNSRVHLEDLSIGNYVTVRAMALPSGPAEYDNGTVGTSPGERPLTLRDVNEDNN
jgi:hypothetical protein